MKARVAAAAGLALAASAGASFAQDRDGLVMGLLDRTFETQRVMLTCSATSAETHQGALMMWQSLMQEIGGVLEEGGASLLAKARMAAAAANPQALILPPETSFADVRALCDASPDWLNELSRFEPFKVVSELRDLFAR